MSSFDNFTLKARAAIILAVEAARRRGEKEIRPEHILFGLVEEYGGVASSVLIRFGVMPDHLEGFLKVTKPMIGWLESDSVSQSGGSTKAVYRWAFEEAEALGHHYIGTEHLLLALCRSRQANLKRILRHFGITRRKVVGEVEQILNRASRQKPRGRLSIADVTAHR